MGPFSVLPNDSITLLSEELSNKYVTKCTYVKRLMLLTQKPEIK
jgi:hypothetical protein